MKIFELEGSRSGLSSNDKSSTGKLVFCVEGAETRWEAEMGLWTGGWIEAEFVLFDGSEMTTRSLVYKSIDTQHMTGELWKCTVNYVDPDRTYDNRPKNGEWKFESRGEVQQVRMRQALEHIATFPEGAPDHGGAILVMGGKVEGVDQPVYTGLRSFTFSHPEGVVTEAFCRNMERKLGYVNNDTWRGYSAGESRFVGFAASDTSGGPAEARYDFSIIENTVNATYGDIENVSHDGHDYVWFEYENEFDVGIKSKVKAVHVDRVAKRTAFNTLFGF